MMGHHLAHLLTPASQAWLYFGGMVLLLFIAARREK
jgi:hypothetical protein